MPKSDSRVAVTLGSEAHRYLLEMWAQLSGRSPANLSSFLLEKAITDALRNGEVPAPAVQAMDQFIEAMAENKAEDHQHIVSMAKEHGSFIDW